MLGFRVERIIHQLNFTQLHLFILFHHHSARDTKSSDIELLRFLILSYLEVQLRTHRLQEGS